MSRSYTSSPPCASMACSGTTLLFFLLYLYKFPLLHYETFSNELYLPTYCWHRKVFKRKKSWKLYEILLNSADCFVNPRVVMGTGETYLRFASSFPHNYETSEAGKTHLRSGRVGSGCPPLGMFTERKVRQLARRETISSLTCSPVQSWGHETVATFVMRSVCKIHKFRSFQFKNHFTEMYVDDIQY
jgi:hypothetical protein